jgi:hypothetical protein
MLASPDVKKQIHALWLGTDRETLVIDSGGMGERPQFRFRSVMEFPVPHSLHPISRRVVLAKVSDYQLTTWPDNGYKPTQYHQQRLICKVVKKPG